MADAQPIEPARANRKKRLEQRRRQLLESAARVMERDGYFKVTMQDIAADAGVSVGLTYQYFESKEDVLFNVIMEILEEYHRELPLAMKPHTNSVARLAAGFSAYCLIINRRRGGAVLAYRESKTLRGKQLETVKQLELESTGLLAEAVADGQKAGIFVPGDPMFFAYNFVMVAHMWALKHWFLSRQMTVYDYIHQQTAFILRSLIRDEHHHRYLEIFEARPGPA
jgi:AcrR family transcriptional regulator